MIVDIHTHIFPHVLALKVLDRLSHAGGIKPFTDGTLDGLRRSMEEAGVEHSVTLPVATSSQQVEKINEFAAKVNEGYEVRGIHSFAAIHPDYTNYRKELGRLKAAGFKGIKVHPAYQETDLDDIRYLRIFERAAEVGLVVITHAGLDIGFPGVVRCSPTMAGNVVSAIGDFPFVLAHMGGWGNWDEVPVKLAGTGVYVDTSFSIGSKAPLGILGGRVPLMEESKALDIIKAFGSGRVLFGSDSPWSSQKESIEAVKKLSIAEEEKADIFGNNACRLLGIAI